MAALTVEPCRGHDGGLLVEPAYASSSAAQKPKSVSEAWFLSLYCLFFLGYLACRHTWIVLTILTNGNTFSFVLEGIGGSQRTLLLMKILSLFTNARREF